LELFLALTASGDAVLFAGQGALVGFADVGDDVHGAVDAGN
jgi:hypothetical protein